MNYSHFISFFLLMLIRIKIIRIRLQGCANLDPDRIRSKTFKITSAIQIKVLADFPGNLFDEFVN